MQQSTIYTRNYLTFLILSLLLTAGVNIVTDPQRIFKIVDKVGFNHEKQSLKTNGFRKIKSIEILNNKNYNTLLIGSSRVGDGLNEKSTMFTPLTAYNTSIPGANMYEMYKIYQFAKQQGQVKRIIVGLDFEFTFITPEVKGLADFTDSGFAGKNLLQMYWENLVSLKTLQHSADTIKFNRSGAKFSFESPYSNREQFDRHLKTESLRLLRIKSYSNPSMFEFLALMVEDCRKNNIELYLVIPPVHANNLEMLRALGLSTEFEQWKRKLVEIVDQNSTDFSSNKLVHLWDFSGYNDYSMEPIPDPKTNISMQWYSEFSHYRKALGDLVLQVMFSAPKLSLNIPSDFGVEINKDNIEIHLAKIRADRDKYLQIFPQEVVSLEKSVKEVKFSFQQSLQEDRQKQCLDFGKCTTTK